MLAVSFDLLDALLCGGTALAAAAVLQVRVRESASTS
jgi:hypothetical protein